MRFIQPLTSGRLLKRYKRFLADIELDSGEIITAHCPNSGSMKSCMKPGWRVMVSQSNNPKRKYKHTWQMIHNEKCWIGINTGIPNLITKEAIENDKIPELMGYPIIKREVKYGHNSRIDILLLNNKKCCYVEVKNVTLVETDGNYYFPDAITERGKKHLLELTNVKKKGHRAVMMFIIQRNDGKIFKPAVHIDPAYADALKEAIKHKVEILVYRADVDPIKIEIAEKIQPDL
jgi:sugar fermentation stimulation protein A